jgi:DNA-binding transcriptional regulator YiaG
MVWRKKHGISREELAERLAVEVEAIHAWEHDLAVPSGEQRTRLSLS